MASSPTYQLLSGQITEAEYEQRMAAWLSELRGEHDSRPVPQRHRAAERVQLAAFVAFGLLLSLAISYGLALLGEPQSVWFWHVLGVMR